MSDGIPMGELYKGWKNGLRVDIYVCVFPTGMEIDYREYSESGVSPRRRLSKIVSEIDTKAVRKLFGGRTDQQMIDRIQQRFSGISAYDDLLQYLCENKVI